MTDESSKFYDIPREEIPSSMDKEFPKKNHLSGHGSAFNACEVGIFSRAGLVSARPEDRFVIPRPRDGVFDFEKQAVFEWLDLRCFGIRFRQSSSSNVESRGVGTSFRRHCWTARRELSCVLKQLYGHTIEGSKLPKIRVSKILPL